MFDLVVAVVTVNAFVKIVSGQKFMIWAKIVFPVSITHLLLQR